MYKENAKRSSFQNMFSDYKEYLKSLEMVAEIGPFVQVYFDRIAQLTNKSNQFNLTTLRCTRDEIEQMSRSNRYITLYGKLKDKFGDNGVVSLVIGEKKEQTLDIILWLMSCRVLKRNMEFAMMDTLVKQCADNDIYVILGHYYPTVKNGMVKDFYGTLGFEKVSEDSDGNSDWLMHLDTYNNLNHVIKVRKELRREE